MNERFSTAPVPGPLADPVHVFGGKPYVRPPVDVRHVPGKNPGLHRKPNNDLGAGFALGGGYAAAGGRESAEIPPADEDVLQGTMRDTRGSRVSSTAEEYLRQF